MPLTLKIINAELAKRGHKARLERGSGYFYFWTGEAADWLDNFHDHRWRGLDRDRRTGADLEITPCSSRAVVPSG
jgi:hypothetical protein